MSNNKEEISDLISSMIKDFDKLKNGYKLLSKFEESKKFYNDLLNIVFSKSNQKEIKLAASVFQTYFKKNYTNEKIFTNEEKLNIVGTLKKNLKVDDYYLKNYIAKCLGFIAVNEFPNCYEGFIKILLKNLEDNNIDENTTDQY